MIFHEHFGESCMILLQCLQNNGALNFVQFFLDHCGLKEYLLCIGLLFHPYEP